MRDFPTYSQNYSNQGVCFDILLFFAQINPVSATHRQPRSPTRRILVAPLTHISLFKLHTSIKIKSYCAHLLTCSGWTQGWTATWPCCLLLPPCPHLSLSLPHRPTTQNHDWSSAIAPTVWLSSYASPCLTRPGLVHPSQGERKNEKTRPPHYPPPPPHPPHPSPPKPRLVSHCTDSLVKVARFAIAHAPTIFLNIFKRNILERRNPIYYKCISIHPMGQPGWLEKKSHCTGTDVVSHHRCFLWYFHNLTMFFFLIFSFRLIVHTLL